MNTYRVQLTPDAKQDLLDAARYVAEASGSKDVALAWYERMQNAVMRLADMPRSYAYARENEAFEEEVRQVVHLSHRLIFTIHDDLGLVLIHRIWHTARENAGPDDLGGVD